MELSISYNFWRTVKVFATVIIFTGLFFGVTTTFDVFIAQAPLVWHSVFFFILLSFALIIIRAPDKEMDLYHENQVRTSRELYATLYNQSPVPYVTLNQSNIVTTCNQAAVRLLQTEMGILTGSKLLDRLSNPEDDSASIALSKLDANVSIYDTEFEISTFKNEKRWVSVSIFINETFNQKLVSLIDMTHHKQVDMAKSEFVALATHQLRTPIAAIRWNVELLERSMRDIATEKHANYLVKINRNVSRMLALINDFLSVSKLEQGTFATNLEVINLREFLATIVDEFQQAVTEKQINLVQTYEPVNYEHPTDTRLFHIIFSNLLSNAVKYVGQNATIQFGYQLTNTSLVFTIADNGIGIPEEQIERLFTKFFRASNALLHKAEGTGLGLYIVQESVTLLGGTIEVNSIQNQGTTFVVTLPLATN